MKKEEAESKKEEAFVLYASGKSIRDIELELKINYNTLWNWKEADNWKERKESIKQKTNEKLDETLADMRIRQIKIVQGIIKKGIKDIIENNARITANEILKAMQEERILRNENQKLDSSDSAKKANEIYYELLEKRKQGKVDNETLEFMEKVTGDYLGDVREKIVNKEHPLYAKSEGTNETLQYVNNQRNSEDNHLKREKTVLEDEDSDVELTEEEEKEIEARVNAN